MVEKTEYKAARFIVDERSLVLRLEAQKLDRVARHRYDLQTNSAVLQPAG